MEIKQRNRFQSDPNKILSLGFAGIILTGAILLSLPFSSREEPVSFIDALFTSTSAVCVTGLVVVDTYDTYSPIGQIIVLALIEAGGLGFMTLATMMMMVLRRRITLRDRLLIQSAVGEFSLQGMVRLIQKIIYFTVMVEIIGVAFFATRFIPYYGLKMGLYRSIFHSVSAFCNAGFDVMGGYKSFTPFRNDLVICYTAMGLIVLGGLGFTVLSDLWENKRFSRLSVHSRTVIITTGVLILLGTAFFMIFEGGNPATLAVPGMDVPMKVTASMFQSITSRTAGFNSIDQNALNPASKLFTSILMFIGASPAGTGGGIKTTTMAVILLMVHSFIRGNGPVMVGKHHLPRDISVRAVSIIFIYAVMVIAAVMIMSLTEQIDGAKIPLENLIFEAVSAISTTGLSTGITSHLSGLAKCILIFLMYAGRVGPLTLTMAFALRISGTHPNITYPEAHIMVG